jgi:hypothetical protein
MINAGFSLRPAGKGPVSGLGSFSCSTELSIVKIVERPFGMFDQLRLAGSLGLNRLVTRIWRFGRALATKTLWIFSVTATSHLRIECTTRNLSETRNLGGYVYSTATLNMILFSCRATPTTGRTGPSAKWHARLPPLAIRIYHSHGVEERKRVLLWPRTYCVFSW